MDDVLLVNDCQGLASRRMGTKDIVAELRLAKVLALETPPRVRMRQITQQHRPFFQADSQRLTIGGPPKPDDMRDVVILGLPVAGPFRHADDFLRPPNSFLVADEPLAPGGQAFAIRRECESVLLPPGGSMIGDMLEAFAAVGGEEHQTAARGDGNGFTVGSKGEPIRLVASSKAHRSQPSDCP